MKQNKFDKRLVVLSIIFLFLLILFILNINPKFTGFVTNVVGDTTETFEFPTGVFENTFFDSESNAIILYNSNIEGNYYSHIFGSEKEVSWDIMDYSVFIPENSSVDFYFKVCENIDCEGEEYVLLEDTNLNLVGKYFQYRIELHPGGESPKIYEVNISYSNLEINSNLSIIIESPESKTYEDEEILIKILTECSNVWYSYDQDNETIIESYTEEIYKNFSEGEYTLIVYVNDSEENFNSSSVSFVVNFSLLPFCGDGECNGNEVCGNSDGDLECGSDCGPCPEIDTPTNNQETKNTENKKTNEVVIPETIPETCEVNWICGEWTECIDDIQTRECKDENNCNIQNNKPLESRECEILIEETCFDGIKNQDEEGIDCGGVCEKKCGIFTIVGNVINGPVESGRIFLQKNWITSLISFGILALGILIFIILKLLRKKKFLKKEKLKTEEKIEDISEIVS